MKNVVTLGKKQITEFLKAYNKGVKSTFGLQKSRHQFAQALNFANWFELEAQLEDSAPKVLSPAQSSRHHRSVETYLAFSIRFDEFESAQSFLDYLVKGLRPDLEARTIPDLDEEALKKTLLKVLTEGYSEDELHMAPSFAEIMEWYDVAEEIFDEGHFTYAFSFGEWDDALTKRVVDGIIKPAFEHFVTKHSLKGRFLGAEIVREFRYETSTPI